MADNLTDSHVEGAGLAAWMLATAMLKYLEGAGVSRDHCEGIMESALSAARLLAERSSHPATLAALVHLLDGLQKLRDAPLPGTKPS